MESWACFVTGPKFGIHCLSSLAFYKFPGVIKLFQIVYCGYTWISLTSDFDRLLCWIMTARSNLKRLILYENSAIEAIQLSCRSAACLLCNAWSTCHDETCVFNFYSNRNNSGSYSIPIDRRYPWRRWNPGEEWSRLSDDDNDSINNTSLRYTSRQPLNADDKQRRRRRIVVSHSSWWIQRRTYAGPRALGCGGGGGRQRSIYSGSSCGRQSFIVTWSIVCDWNWFIRHQLTQGPGASVEDNAKSRQKYMQTDTQTGRETDKQTGRNTNKHIRKETSTHKGCQINDGPISEPSSKENETSKTTIAAIVFTFSSLFAV